MKNRDEIERLLAQAIKRQNEAIAYMIRTANTPESAYMRKDKDAAKTIMLTAGVIVALELVLQDGPLSAQDERFFLIDCG